MYGCILGPLRERELVCGFHRGAKYDQHCSTITQGFVRATYICHATDIVCVKFIITFYIVNRSRRHHYKLLMFIETGIYSMYIITDMVHNKGDYGILFS